MRIKLHVQFSSFFEMCCFKKNYLLNFYLELTLGLVVSLSAPNYYASRVFSRARLKLALKIINR